MVVFTCNHCGESLQKPKVEKHYQFSCRKPVFLTCVDCLKDFRGDEFDVHTKCFTEDERYGAKGQVNGVVKKGEVKQESWVEMIRSIIKEEPNMKPPHRNLLNRISAYNNVPRKKPKFMNFIKSSHGGRVNMDDVEAVWDIIEKYKKRHSSTVASETKENKSEPQLQDNLDNSESVTTNKQKKKKKETVNAEDMSSENGITQEDAKPKKISKRKSGDVSEDIPIEQDVKEVEFPTENGEKVEKKKKKKKSSNQPQENSVENGVKENEEAQQPAVETQQTEKDDPQAIPIVQEKEKTKKKSKKNAKNTKSSEEEKYDAENTSLPESVEENGIAVNGKSKNKAKRKSNPDTENSSEPAEKRAKQEDTEQSLNESKDSITFDFKMKIMEVLQAVDSISLKKLEKRIKKMYLSETGATDFSEKLLKKYNKKLKQLDNIELTDNNVRLIKTAT